MDYEKTSYRGLFNFVRYIEQLQAYQVDYGEVNLTGAGNTAVEIMTIHKSKGLEFPVVFVAGMGKQFNFQDMNAGLLLHPELGIGADAIIPEKRVIASSLNKQVIRRQLLKESLGEELRVLYVAMTRAKEKLILKLVGPPRLPFMVASRDSVAYHMQLCLVFVRAKLAGDIFAGAVNMLNVPVKHAAEPPVKIIVCQLDVL